MNEPIMEFKDEAQAYKCLKEWQTRLFLDDWIIKINLDDISVNANNNEAENNYVRTINVAVINFAYIHKDIDKDIVLKTTKYCVELTLVHELLHCKFTFTDGIKKTTEGNYFSEMEHVLIEQMAKSLIMAKYGLTFDWFKNF